MNNDHPYRELREKLIAGTKLAFKRLVEKAKIDDDYLVFSENEKLLK